MYSAFRKQNKKISNKLQFKPKRTIRPLIRKTRYSNFKGHSGKWKRKIPVGFNGGQRMFAN